jgi:putative porin
MRRRGAVVGVVLVGLVLCASAAHAADLGDILLKKGLITPEELRQAREEEQQKAKAEESRREAILAKLPKWLDYITPFGDVRTRYEGFYENDLTARNRFRMRARVGLNANVTDELSATVRLASGNPNNPISTNQDFTNTFDPWPVNLDWAYMTVKPGKTFGIEPGWFTLIAGKFAASTAVYRTSELVWDEDLSPEGAAEALNLLQGREGFFRTVKLNSVQWVVDEVAAASDPWMFGGQLVTEMAPPLLDNSVTWTFAVADYSYQGVNEVASKYLSPFTGTADPVTGFPSNSSQNTQLANSNTVTLSAPDAKGQRKVTGFAEGFNILDVSTELNFVDPFGLGIPAGVFGDLAYNSKADSRNTGFYVGAGIGQAGKDWYNDKLSNPGDWGASYTFAWVEKDAVFSMFSLSDINWYRSWTNSSTKNGGQIGSSNVIASIPRLDYMLFQNFQLTAKALIINPLDRGIATTPFGTALSNSATPLGPAVGDSTLVHVQFDAVLRF